ncbi:hypothetical protein F4678DRAFT_477670 [Xylaria arbuscula]|nr:hypothetical protein F4678DRAFT_477670 [Xylaria arbuscula]
MDHSYLTFHLFPKLPPELRNKIWHYALPSDLGPALYTYKKGCWRGRDLLPSEASYDPVNLDQNLVVKYRHDLLDEARINVPLAFVNSEAHGIALQWAEAQHPRVRTCIEERQFVFLRRFIPDRDALFVRDWDAIFLDAADAMFAPELLDRFMTVWPGIMRIAVTKPLLQARHDCLSDLFYDNWHSVRALYISVDMPQEQHISTENSAGMHKLLLECENLHEVALWTGSDWDFDLSYPPWGGNDARQLVELAGQGLRAGLEEWNVSEFKIFLYTCTM